MIARLDLRLPRFLRHLWTSPAARARWEPRFEALRGFVAELEFAAAVARTCAMLRDPAPADFAALRASAKARGLTTLRLPERPDIAPQYVNPTLIAAPDHADALAGAWHRGEREAVLAGLGLPPCCVAAYVDAHLATGWRDGAWVTLAATGETIDGPPGLNRLLERVGLTLVAHDACRPDCAAARSRTEERVALARARDPAALAELLEILDWPMEWSALHGAAELRTPVVKLCWDTDATATTVVRRRAGGSWPAHGAVGQRFPYRPPERHRLVASIGWRRGLAHAEGGS